MSMGVQFPEHYKHDELFNNQLIDDIRELKAFLVKVNTQRDYYRNEFERLSELVESNNSPKTNEDGV